MNIEQKVEILVRLKNYIENNSEEWQIAKQDASRANPWFNDEFINLASNNIATHFLDEIKLKGWLKRYPTPTTESNKTVGIVMAGNIPLVGFHDFLCVFLSGHNALIKASSKDEVLIKHLVMKLKE